MFDIPKARAAVSEIEFAPTFNYHRYQSRSNCVNYMSYSAELSLRISFEVRHAPPGGSKNSGRSATNAQ
jgi:hypothetical protein